MEIRGNVTLPGERQRVWTLLMDPDVLRTSVPGCQAMVLTGPDTYQAELSLGIAAIKGHYKGLVTVLNKRPPEAFRLQVEGKGTPGWVKAVVDLELAEQGEETLLTYYVDAQVGGMVAAVGQRVLGGVAKMLLSDLLETLRGELEARRREGSTA